MIILNIWNSYKGSWFGQKQEFPIVYTSDFKPKWSVECSNQSELLDCILREYQHYLDNHDHRSLYKSVLAKFDQRLLLDREIQAMIERYNYCTATNTPPFPGSYDDQPAYWVDFVNILLGELPKMSEK